MTLAQGTDRLETARLLLRRIAPDDPPFFTRIHALPEVARGLWPGGLRRSPMQTEAYVRATLESYERLALGYLGVLRKGDGALIGRCGLTELAVESATPGHGIRKGWFGDAQAPAGAALMFECELGYTFDPPPGARVTPPRQRIVFAITRATFCICRTLSRPFFRRTLARGGSLNGAVCAPTGKWRRPG
jgi:hypothetical protein